MLRPVSVSREQVLRYRIAATMLDARRPATSDAYRVAAWAGLQDSMPRAALVSLHARIEGVGPDGWDHPGLIQVWGPRYSSYVVAREDLAVFTLGRLPHTKAALERARGTARRIQEAVADRELPYADVGRLLGVNPNSLRYAATTGTVAIRWEGSGQPTLQVLQPPAMPVREARAELARRYFRVFGPGTTEGFARWAGVTGSLARQIVDDIAPEMIPCDTPVGAAAILASDERLLVEAPESTDTVRLLPSGDTYYLLQGAARELLVPDGALRERLWTSRVWPGAILVGCEIVGTWRRAGRRLTLEPWRVMTGSEQRHIEREARSLPIPGVEDLDVQWDPLS